MLLCSSSNGSVLNGCCEPVETPHKSCDDPAGHHVSLPGPGYIANLVTEATGCGRTHSPWRIEAQPGQTIRLSLLDFTRAPATRRRCVPPSSATTTRLPGGLDAAPCPPLAVVREPVAADANAGGWHNVTVTARRRLSGTTVTSRENLVYVSQGHVVEVAILTNNDAADVPYFMLKYEGKIATYFITFITFYYFFYSLLINFTIIITKYLMQEFEILLL